MSKEALKHNIWKLKWFKIFMNSIAIVVPTIVLFWQNNGLSLLEIMILQSLFSIAMVLLEIPSGYFADLHGRKASLLWAALICLFAFVVYILSSGFWSFLLAELLLATAFSLYSGADSSLAFDSLKEMGEEKDFKSIWGGVMSAFLIGMTVFNFGGGYLAEMGERVPFYVAFGLCFVSLPIALSMKEPKRHKRIVKQGYLKELIGILWQEVAQNPVMRSIFLFNAVIFSLMMTGLWFYNPVFELGQIDLAYYGVIFAAFNVVAAISSKYAHKLEERVGKMGSFFVLFLALFLSYFLMSRTVFWAGAFIFAFGQQFVRGFRMVVIDDYIHNLTSSDIRATVLSANNMIGRLFYAILLPVVGWYADVYSIPQTLLMISIVAAVSGLLLFFVLQRGKVFAETS